MSADPLLILLALLLDLLIGDPRWLPHPIVAIGSLIALLDRKLRRNWLDERLAGGLLLGIVVVCSGGSLWLLLQLLDHVMPLAGWLVAVAMSSTCLAVHSLHKESFLVASALSAGNLPEARRYLSYIVGRDTDGLEEHEIWRAVIETVAENTSDGIIAPLFWLATGGPIAAISYKAVSTLDSMVGYKNERYLYLGWASARMDDLLNFVPARLSAILIIIAAPLAGLSARQSARITARDRLNHPSPNSGHPEAAAAGALGVRLGGYATYCGVSSCKEYIGDCERLPDEQSYRDMIKLMYISTGLMAFLCMIATLSLRGLRDLSI